MNTVAPAVREIREIRKELAESGADPFEVAAIALAEVRRYREELARVRQELGR